MLKALKSPSPGLFLYDLLRGSQKTKNVLCPNQAIVKLTRFCKNISMANRYLPFMLIVIGSLNVTDYFLTVLAISMGHWSKSYNERHSLYPAFSSGEANTSPSAPRIDLGILS